MEKQKKYFGLFFLIGILASMGFLSAHEIIDYDSGCLCLDTSIDSSEISEYVIALSGAAGHLSSMNSLCGLPGAYYVKKYS